MRLLLFGVLPFETDEVPPDVMVELLRWSNAYDVSLKKLIEDNILYLAETEVLFTSDDLQPKNFALDCSNFWQFASRMKH